MYQNQMIGILKISLIDEEIVAQRILVLARHSGIYL